MIGFADPEGGHATRDLVTTQGLPQRIHEAFSENGILSHSDNFEYREPQQRLAVHFAESLENGTPFIAEAGTGVGKSLAYLLPAAMFSLETGRKVVLSTHTINLQEQLFYKDIPIVQGLLDTDLPAALLIGRQNYLCPNRLKFALRGVGDLFSSTETEQLTAIQDWSMSTESGLLSELNFQPDFKVWSQVCSDPYLCTPQTCGKDGSCFYHQARKKVLGANLIVLNHTLFFAMAQQTELMEQECEGFLFADDAVVLDEAHTIEQVAASQFGIRLSQAGLNFDLNKLYNQKTKKGLLVSHGDARSIQAVQDVQAHTETFFQNLYETLGYHENEQKRETRIREPEIVENTLAGHYRNLWERIDDLAEDTEHEHSQQELRDAARRVRDASGSIGSFLDQKDPDFVYWVEPAGKDSENLTLRSAPIETHKYLQPMLFQPGKTCLLTSATLGAGDPNLNYFKSQVGAHYVNHACIDSPFDYPRQMKVRIAASMPEPSDDEFELKLARWVYRAIRESEGSAFVLFTSYRLLMKVAEVVETHVEDLGYRLLKQGDGLSRQKMIDTFRKDESSVLFGTDSFWAGVDVPGNALRNVIITRLPFAVPDHPLVAAKIENLQAQGRNAFMEYNVPEAALKFRQGIGRLIRSQSDEGYVYILDPRIVTKRYGNVFMNSFPKGVEIIQK